MKKSIRGAAALFCLGVFWGTLSPLWAQPAEDDGSFTGFVTSLLREDPGNDAVREKIIEESLSLPVTLRVPKHALELMDKAKGILQKAQTHEEFKEAVSLYQQALGLAPWSAAIYYNLAVAQANAGRPGNAAKSLHFYLVAAPHAKDRAQVLAMIQELEAKKVEQPVTNQEPNQELEQNIKSLQLSPDNLYLKETIIKEVQGMSSPPALPYGVEEKMSEAASDVRGANSFGDFQTAIQAYKQAILMAPWVPELYQNLAMIEERASRVDEGVKKYAGFNYHPSDKEHSDLLDDAIRNMRLYLLAAPGAGDQAQAQDLLNRWMGKRDMEKTMLVLSYAPSATNLNYNGIEISAQGNIATTYSTNVSVSYVDWPMTEVCSLAAFQPQELGVGLETDGIILRLEYWHAQIPTQMTVNMGYDTGYQVGTSNLYHIGPFSYQFNSMVTLDDYQLDLGYDVRVNAPYEGLGPVQVHFPLEIEYGVINLSAPATLGSFTSYYNPLPPILGGGGSYFNFSGSIGLGLRMYFLEPFALDVVEKYKFGFILPPLGGYTSESTGQNPNGTVWTNNSGPPTDSSNISYSGFQTQVSLDLSL